MPDRAHLDVLRDQVRADRPMWRSAGVDICSLGQHPESGLVEVGVRGDAAARSLLQDHYGAGVRVFYTDIRPATPHRKCRSRGRPSFGSRHSRWLENRPYPPGVAVVVVPNYEPSVMARWAFRALTERAAAYCTNPADAYALRQAQALDGLHFDLLASDQARTVAVAVVSAADGLRDELRDAPEERDREFSDMCADISLRLTGIASGEG